MMRFQLQLLLCTVFMACTMSYLSNAATLPRNQVLQEERSAKPNQLQAARILQAAAAQVTPGYGRGGHRARRAIDHHEILMQERQQQQRDSEALDAVRVLKAAAAQVTPGFGRGGHRAREEDVSERSSAVNLSDGLLIVKKKRAAGACIKKVVTVTVTVDEATITTKSTSTSTSKTSTTSKSSTTTTSTSTTSSKTTTTSSSTSTSGPSASATCGSSTYGYTQARADLDKIMKWAWATDMQTEAQKNETVFALLDVAARYYPELKAQSVVRYLLADINAESTFNVTAYNGGRMDSGASLGLMQVSPGSGAQILPLFMGHARVTYNNYSWSDTKGPCGPLLDYKTGQQLSLATLTSDDLFRPWINIHVGAWVQSNLARTASNDPWYWTGISKSAYSYLVAKNNYDAAATAGSGLAAAQTALTKANSTLQADLVGAGLSRSLLTGAGSWVAGPAVDGDGSYNTAGDDISAPYFENIVKGLQAIYEDSSYNADWLNSLVLTPGLVDYR